MLYLQTAAFNLVANFTKKTNPLKSGLVINAILTFAGDPLTAPVTSWNLPSQLPAKQILEINGRYLCSLCNESFVTKSSCYNHFQVHLGNTTCKICNKVLGSRQKLAHHLAKHQANVRCEKCKHTFSSISELTRHKQKYNC